MDIPYRTGTLLMGLGILLLFVSSLGNILLAAVTIPGSMAGVRALRQWNSPGGTDAPLWAGVALICAGITAMFAVASGALAWIAWTWITAGLIGSGCRGTAACGATATPVGT